MDSTIIPILILAGFVIFPFATIAITRSIVSRSRHKRYPLRTTIMFAVGGCVLAIGYVASSGLGKYPSVTIIGAAVFLFAFAATGGLIGVLANLFIPEQPNDTDNTKTNRSNATSPDAG